MHSQGSQSHAGFTQYSLIQSAIFLSLYAGANQVSFISSASARLYLNHITHNNNLYTQFLLKISHDHFLHLFYILCHNETHNHNLGSKSSTLTPVFFITTSFMLIHTGSFNHTMISTDTCFLFKCIFFNKS